MTVPWSRGQRAVQVVRQVVNPTTTGHSAPRGGVALVSAGEVPRGDAAAGRNPRAAACLLGPPSDEPLLHRGVAAVEPLRARPSGAHGGVRRPMARATVNVSAGG